MASYDQGDSSGYTSYIILIFIIILGCIFAFDPSSQRCISFFKDIFQSIADLLNDCLGKRILSNQNDQSSSRSFYSLMNENR